MKLINQRVLVCAECGMQAVPKRFENGKIEQNRNLRYWHPGNPNCEYSETVFTVKTIQPITGVEVGKLSFDALPPTEIPDTQEAVADPDAIGNKADDKPQE